MSESDTLLDYLATRQIAARAFDTEMPRGTLKRFHPDQTELVDVTHVPDQMKIFDTIHSAEVPVTVKGAGQARPGLFANDTYLRLGGLAGARRSGGRRFCQIRRCRTPFCKQTATPRSAPS